MTYIVENNGVYGLTKGQFSATSDKGSKAKKGAINNDEPIDLVGIALQLEDAGLLSRPVARFQHGARAHAVGADRCEPGESRSSVPRRIG